FGGVSIIFAGDFTQLPPVGDSRLFSRVRTSSGSEAAQKHVQGKLLWFSVDVVVILQQVMRQDGESNNTFVALLGQLHTGTCTEDDFKLLNMQLASRVKPDWDAHEWNMVPLILSQNVVKDAYNEQAAHAFAAKTGRTLHYYYAVDR
ncbi:hypothetical protein ARMGADRAFT_859243, partial [Armillaria gallica]